MPAKLPEGAGKRHAINIRTTRELKERIDRAAAKSGRSVASEVEARVQHSLSVDDYDDAINNTELANSIDGETEELISAMRAAAGAAMMYVGNKWKTDIYARAAVRAALIAVMDTTFTKYPYSSDPDKIDMPRALQADKFGRLAGRMLSAAQSDPAMRAWVSEMAAASEALEGLNAHDNMPEGEERRSVALKALIGADA
ncbi:Arc family DNA-binding protein [Methylobacterium thuringiense]|uniref:Arc family DNA-binding protein n=1 Tax=Methylobacterium thuringiense TaxID=1003091 RepID=UPI001EDFF5B7|nr:Arc family DNA-binding protein [Methylobacterium thuringiense]